MSTLSCKERTRVYSRRRSFLCWSVLLIGSSASGFTTSSFGQTNRHNNHQNRGRRQRLPCAFQQRTEGKQFAPTASTALPVSFSGELPLVGDLISTYAYCLKYHYFPTQSITNAVLTAVGDGLAQAHEEKERMSADSTIPNRNYYDPKRGLVYFFKGLGSGIMWAWWFDAAEVWSMELTHSVLSQTSNGLEAVEFASTTSTEVLDAQGQALRTGINILLEQFLVCPILFTVWDIPVTSLMRGSSFERVPAQIREKLAPLLVANAKVWTLVNIVTYNIPLEYRLLFTSAASIVSESINSGITSKQIETPAPPIPALPVLTNNDSPLASSNPLGMGSPLSSAASTVSIAAAVVPLISSSGGKNMTMLEI